MRLPLMDFGGQQYGAEHLVEHVETATALGFDAVAVNDHMVFGVPWLGGPPLWIGSWGSRNVGRP